jgi:glycosyltransferase involved in cell wall biosynthesis
MGEPTATLSVLIPAYNEAATIERVVRSVRSQKIPGVALQVIVIDDGSTDGTDGVCRSLGEDIDVFIRKANGGKGSAVRRGLAAATGDFVLVQDADLEYSPSEYGKLLAPLLEGKADMVLGSRFAGSEAHRVVYFWHMVGNRLLTLLSNVLTDLNLTDMECGFKVFRTSLLKSIELTEDGFGFEPEVVAKLAKQRCRVYEVGVSYHGRTYAEGKKIGIKDGFRALYAIAKHNLLR